MQWRADHGVTASGNFHSIKNEAGVISEHESHALEIAFASMDAQERIVIDDEYGRATFGTRNAEEVVGKVLRECGEL